MRKIKIGLLSADFYKHSAARSWGCLLEGYDKQKFHLTCYANNSQIDQYTKAFQAQVDSWRWIINMSDLDVCKQINQDKIDILIDLSGHTVGNRLGVFVLKPAQIQITGLGFCHTTGLKQMDYIFCDRGNIPEALSRHIREKPLYLPSFIHWQPPEDMKGIEISQPHKSNGFITFGSGNNLFKHNGDVIRVWSEIINKVSHSRLKIKAKPFDDFPTAQYYYDLFDKYGVKKERVDLIGSTTHAEHLEFYNSIDIALDTFPYQGGITTCETIWMGKPVVILDGGTRAGSSILRNLGYTGFPENETQYSNWAVSLAEIIQGGNDMFKPQDPYSMRQKILDSNVCNTELFRTSIYAHLEAVYLKMLEVAA